MQSLGDLPSGPLHKMFLGAPPWWESRPSGRKHGTSIPSSLSLLLAAPHPTVSAPQVCLLPTSWLLFSHSHCFFRTCAYGRYVVGTLSKCHLHLVDSPTTTRIILIFQFTLRDDDMPYPVHLFLSDHSRCVCSASGLAFHKSSVYSNPAECYL